MLQTLVIDERATDYWPVGVPFEVHEGGGSNSATDWTPDTVSMWVAVLSVDRPDGTRCKYVVPG